MTAETPGVVDVLTHTPPPTTASAVMGDVCDVARGLRLPTFGVPATELEEVTPAQSNSPAPYYLRLQLLDRPGAMAKVTTALGEAGISIDRMRQSQHEGGSAPVLIVTHKTQRSALTAAIEDMRGTGVLENDPVALRIESV